MRWKSTQAALLTMAAVAFEFQGCHVGPVPSVPDLSGTYISHAAIIHADQKTVDEIMAAYKRAEEAVQRRDLSGVMAFYSENYQHRGLRKVEIKRFWSDLFERYHDFSSTHVLTRITSHTDTTPPKSDVACTGSVWAIANQTNQRENIDSWFDEVHNLVYENGAWRIRGNAWEGTPRAGSVGAPPHAFF